MTILFLSTARAEVSLTTLVSFTNDDNGAVPAAGLVQGLDGAFYGTTEFGGASGCGTLFRIDSTGAFSNLLSFTGTGGNYPGANPAAGLILGADGSLYGTTQNGGANNDGTVFELTPAGGFTSLVSFSGTAGAWLGAGPAGSLVWGTNGALYGTTQFGGTNDVGNSGDGTVFELTTNGIFTSLVSFTGTNGACPGANPAAGLVRGRDGFFYGTTTAGGTNDLASYGDGTVFRMTATGALENLFSFNDAVNGSSPQAGLTEDAQGNFYGTASGGELSLGTIFKMASSGVLTVLVMFNSDNGANPEGRLVQGPDNNFYSTTRTGGQNNDGTIFQITPAGALTTLISFGGTNGAYPVAGLTPGTDGNWYGTTAAGTSAPRGTVFRLPPPPAFLGAWQTSQALHFAWSSATGQIYQVQFTTNLDSINWINLGSPIGATNASTSTSDSTGSGPQRYYRVGLQ